MSQATTPTNESRAEENGETPPTDEQGLQTNPTLQPTLIWLGLSLLAGVAVIAYLLNNPDMFEDPGTANLVVRVVALLTVLLVIRFLVRVYVLTRTEYVVDDYSVKRRYELLFRSRQREVPLSMVRSHEVRQSRIQKLLGYGTISLNEGLGPVDLEDVPEPHDHYEQITHLIDDE